MHFACVHVYFFHRDRRSLRGSKGQICQNSPIPIQTSNFKQCQMAKLRVPTCWPRSNMQKCPRWPFCPTYGSGVIGQICQNSPIPIRRSNFKQRQILKLLVPTCWPWTNMQEFPRWPFRRTNGWGVKGQICQTVPFQYEGQIINNVKL